MEKCISKWPVLRFVCVCLVLGAVPAGIASASQDIVNPEQFDAFAKQVSDALLSLRWIEQVKDKVYQTHENADNVYEVLVANGRKQEAEQFLAVKQKLVATVKQMPQRREGFFTTVQEMLNYRNQQLPKAMQDLKLNAEMVAKYQKELDALLREHEEQKKKSGAKTDSGDKGEETDAGGSDWDASGVELYFLGSSGEADFSIDGKRDMEVGDTYPLENGSEIQVVALVNWGEKRRTEMEKKHGNASVDFTHGRTWLNYKANLPDGSVGETKWEVVEESYAWFPVSTRVEMDWKASDSGLSGVKNNMLTLTVPRPMKITANVTAKAKWKTTYKTHGNPIEEDDEEKASVEFSISPK